MICFHDYDQELAKISLLCYLEIAKKKKKSDKSREINPLTSGKLAENGILKPCMPFSDYWGGKLLANWPKGCLQRENKSFLSTLGQIDQI